MRAWQRCVDLTDEFLKVGFHFLPWGVPEFFYTRQNFNGNHLTAIHLVLFHKAIAKLVVFVERFLNAFGADVFTIGEDDEVFDAAHDVHETVFVVTILKKYKDDLPGGVFHCFTGNAIEAHELLQFDRFVLGIGGVLTFKKSKLPETLAEVVPLERIVMETDAPYMAPLPMRGQRNEPAFVVYVCRKLAEVYGVSEERVDAVTTANVARIFGIVNKS